MRTAVLTAKRSVVLEITLIVTFTLLMVISANIRIPLPFTPVPLTLQTFVLYLNLRLMKKKAFLSQCLYVMLGIIGLPVFTNAGSGILYMFGPTGGYLLGFLATAFILPYFQPQKDSFLNLFMFFFTAAVVIYSLGVGWLVFMHHFIFTSAITLGVVPFVYGEIIKLFLAATFPLKGLSKE